MRRMLGGPDFIGPANFSSLHGERMPDGNMAYPPPEAEADTPCVLGRPGCVWVYDDKLLVDFVLMSGLSVDDAMDNPPFGLHAVLPENDIQEVS